MKHRAAITVALFSIFAGTCAVETAASAVRTKVLRFGVIAFHANEPDRVLRVYADLLTEMARRLKPQGFEVAPLVIARDLPELSRLLGRGEVDMVAETVFVTLDLQQEPLVSLTPRLAIVRREEREYHTVFFTRKDGAIRSLEQLRGRTLVLQAERSTSAFAVPRAELAGHGIPMFPAGQPRAPRDAASFVFAGAEVNQAVWVLYGRGDAGAFNEGDWDRLPRKIRDSLTIFHETRPLLRGLVSFRTGLDGSLRQAAEAALLDVHKEEAGREALRKADGVTRFDRLTDTDRASLSGWKRALSGVTGTFK